jgi:two-component system sensor histidine kinase ChiS
LVYCGLLITSHCDDFSHFDVRRDKNRTVYINSLIFNYNLKSLDNIQLWFDSLFVFQMISLRSLLRFVVLSSTRNNMNNYFKIILLITLTLLCHTVSAQKQDIKFRHLSLEEGLSQSTINTIFQDSQGFLWIGTQDGLNKYDGYQFTIYRHHPKNPHSLSHNLVFAIEEDSHGALWIGTLNGLNRFDRQKNQFTHYFYEPDNPNSLSHNLVLSIDEDKTGVLWVGTYGGGLNQFNRQTNQFTHFKHDPNQANSLSHNEIWPMYPDKTGILWIGTNGGGLNQFDRKRKTFTHYLPAPQNANSTSNVISFIYEDKTGAFWLGTLNGLYQFDRLKKTFVHYQHDPQNPNSLSHNTILAISEDSQGKLWVATDGGGLNQFDRLKETFVHYTHDSQNPTSLSNNAVLSLYKDRNDTLWIGTGGGGLNQFNRLQQKFKHYFHDPKNPNSLNKNYIVPILKDKEDILWIGTYGGGLNRFDQKQEQVTYYLHDPENPDSLSHNKVQSIYEDSQGILWIGTFGGGLNQFNRQKNRFVSYSHQSNDPNSLSDDYILSIYEDSTQTLWIGTRKGLNRFDRTTQKFIHYQHDEKDSNSLSDDEVYAIYEDKSGALWIGTLGGLSQLNPKRNHFVHYQHDKNNLNSLSHNEVSTIYEDKSGRLWIGTYGGGLNKFDRVTGHFHAYREEDGLANDVIYGILEDNQGHLWISSNKGLSKFNPMTETFRNYDVLDGLQSNEFNVASYYKSRQGELFFGGIKGFNAFYPEQVTDNPHIPPIVITDFKIFNQSVPLGDNSPLQQHISETREMTLSYKQSFFSFEFAALNFLQPTKNQYAYQLEGFDQQWNEIGGRRNANYTNVPHGTYVFRVKGSNNDGVWNEQGTAIKITILPPPWKTWWAYTLYVLSILAIIISYVWKQKQKLREKQQELEREKAIAAQLKEADRLKDEFLANTSHELRTPLNGIIGIAESLIDGATGKLSQKTNKNLGMIVSSGRRLLNLVNDILDFSRLKQKELDLQLKTIDMQTIADLVLALSQSLIGNKPVQLKNTISSDLPPINADENRVQQILYNLVGNAIKFTDSGTITISAEMIEMVPSPSGRGFGPSDQYLAITVSDTGIGIPAEKLERIFEAFEQADGSTGRIYGGTGLGLAVTQQLVRLHGGRLSVQSQINEGSQFTFTLPLQSSDNQLSVISGQLSQQEPRTTTQIFATQFPEPEIEITENEQPTVETVNSAECEFSILIVDDEPVNRQVLLNHLSLQNYYLIEAESGVEALAHLEQDNKPDLILLDIMMPHITGYEVTQKVRETWTADELPIILLTAKNQVADLVLGLESGANDYLTKPVSKDELIARLKTHLHILQLKAESLRLAIENKNRLEQFLESVPVGIEVHDADGQLFYHNQRTRQILGTETQSLTTTTQLASVSQLYVTDTGQPCLTSQLPIVRALAGQSSTISNVEIRHNDQIISLEMWGNPIFDDKGNIIYAINALQDITERKQAELARLAAEKKYRTIFENAIEGIFQCTPEGRYLSVNPAFVRMFCYDSAEQLYTEINHIGKQLYVHPEQYQTFLTQLETDSKVQDFEYQAYCRDKRIIWVQETVRAVRDNNGQLSYYEGMLEDITQRKQAEEKLRYDATHDQLTGLFNRAAFTEALTTALTHLKEKVERRKWKGERRKEKGNLDSEPGIKRDEEIVEREQKKEVKTEPLSANSFPLPFAALFIDLDRFKIINDSMGHLVGDELLTEIASRLDSEMTETENDIVARLGGDEFALIFKNIPDLSGLELRTHRIQQQLSQPYFLKDETFKTTASIGIALGKPEYETADEVLRDADTAMYEAKRQGGGKSVIFQPGMHTRVVNLLRMERDLRQAIEQEQFCLYYQPIIALATGKTVGLEALIRWIHPKQGLIPPDLFIPLAEETGLIKDLGLWVFETACSQLRHWQTQFIHHADLGMNINVSPIQLKQPNFVHIVSDILDKTGIQSHTCRVEITESAMMQNPDGALAILHELKQLGILLYIDDFGTGYSSLSYLQQFPIDALKIDKSFIQKIDASAKSAQIAHAIIALGEAFDLKVVAEGVENPFHIAMLKATHCHHLQGYYFSRPKDAQSIEEFLRIETHDITNNC